VTAVEWLLRLLLAVIFALAGALKLADPATFAVEVSNYRLLPELAPYIAVCLPPTELVVAAALLVGPRPWARAGALAAAALLGVFNVGVAQVLVRGINISCGCFGGSSGPVNGWTLARDLALLAGASVLVIRLGAPRASGAAERR
jgi:hypothetical protein